MNKLFFANCIFYAAPSFIYLFDYFLKFELLLSNKDFTLKYLLLDVLFYIGLLLITKILLKISKAFFMRAISIAYIVSLFLLILVIKWNFNNINQKFSKFFMIIYTSFY